MKIKVDLSKMNTQAEVEALRCAAVAILSALPRDEAELAFLEWRAVQRVQSSDDEVAEPKVEQEERPRPLFGVGDLVRAIDGRVGMVISPGPDRTWVRFGSSMPDEPVLNNFLTLIPEAPGRDGDTSQEQEPSADAAAGWHGDASQGETSDNFTGARGSLNA